MLRPFDGLSGNELEDWFAEFFANHLQLRYYRSPGQIDLKLLYPKKRRGHHLEIDGFLLINKTCVFVEFTNQRDDFRGKVKKFARNCHLFLESRIDHRDKFKIFGVPEEDMDDIEDIVAYKYLYIGTSEALENEFIDRNDFPDYPEIQSSLYIFKSNAVEYLRQLTHLINIYARNDFYAALDFSPSDLGLDNSSIHLDFIKADGKYITSDQNIRADLYLFKIKVKDLLTVGRVSRYEGIPFMLDEGEELNSNFQRFLIESKLDHISSTFILNNQRKSFPNTITLVLNDDCIEQRHQNKMRLTIPRAYGSIDIIDGQHRVFAYTRPNLSQQVRDNSELLASAIKFYPANLQNKTSASAKVFCEINGNQSKVKNNLLYLIKYEVLGDRDYTALAGKVLLDCNKGGSALGSIFLTNSLRRDNILSLPAVPITTIVDLELVPFLKGTIDKRRAATDLVYQRIFGNSRDHFENGNQLDLINKAREILERYFNLIRTIFRYDWVRESESHLVSAKYISAFLRLLRMKLFVDGESITGMRQILQNVKLEVDSVTEPNRTPTFPKGINTIPTTKHGINTIYEFLDDITTFSID